MFDQIKKMNELRNMQNALKQEKAEVEKNGVKVVMNGNMELVEVKLNSMLDISEQEMLLKQCFSEAKDQIQKVAMKKMMESGIGF
jgi:DNA-binding protein YbaB